MAGMRQCEFFLLRYVPSAVQDEFVNVGLVMIEPDAGFAEVRFARDWHRVQCLDPQADLDMLQAMEDEIRRDLLAGPSRELLLRRLQDSSSNLLQLSATRGCLTNDPAKEIELLAKFYFDVPKPGPRNELSGRKRIVRTMEKAFEQAGLGKAIFRDIPVAPYTNVGDPFKFDFGYRVGSSIKIFQAVAMKASVDPAVMLASRYPAIARAISEKEHALSSLTAVAEDKLDVSDQEVKFALGMMADAQIRVAIASEMPQLAEDARLELANNLETLN